MELLAGAVRQGATVLHRDHDLQVLARHTHLRVVE